MSPSFVKDILPWLTPPIVGAVIGYVTNDIAIRMLFRPLREVRVFGLRVPFTPGIFPKERYALARSIGRMVSSELITQDALRQQIHAEKTVTALSRSISTLTGQILQTPLTRLAELGMSMLTGTLQDFLRDTLRKLFGSRALMSTVRDIVGRLLESLSAKKVRELLLDPGVKGFVTGTLAPLLAEGKNRDAIASAVASAFTDNLGTLLSDRVLDDLAAAAEPLAPRVTDRIVEWLRSPETRAYMSDKGRELLPRILEKLNVLQRFLLSAGQFDRRLTEKMPEIVDETVATLESIARDPLQQRKVVRLLVGAAREWRDGSAAAGELSATVARLVSRMLEGLVDPADPGKLYEGLVARLLPGDPTVEGFARQVLGMSYGDLAESLSARVLSFLTKSGTAETLSERMVGTVERFLAENASATIAEVLHVDQERKEKLDAFLLAKLVALLDERMPEILRGVDVEGLVVQKIDGLDVRDVERLLVQVIATHLKWINVFGAILGFVIGLFQLVLRLIGLS